MTAGKSAMREVVKGSCEQIVRVRVPVPGVFREAVFFLHEDYLRRDDLSREELLRQARRAAADYLTPCLPQRPPRRWLPPALFFAGLALGLALGLRL